MFISADTIELNPHKTAINRYTYATSIYSVCRPTGHCINHLCIGEVALIVTGKFYSAL
jgi:hypothetical protein